VRVAGGSAELLFTRDAVLAIHEHSKGIPRTVSVICDNALVGGFAADIKPVGRDIVLEVCRDFQFADLPVAPVEAPVPMTVPVTVPTPPPVPSRPPQPEAAPAPRARAAADKSADSQPMFSDFTRPKRFSFF
jgi:hypothetical protein